MNEIRQAEVDGQPVIEIQVRGRPPWSQGPLSPLPAEVVLLRPQARWHRLVFTVPEWNAFLDGAKKGLYDVEEVPADTAPPQTPGSADTRTDAHAAAVGFATPPDQPAVGRLPRDRPRDGQAAAPESPAPGTQPDPDRRAGVQQYALFPLDDRPDFPDTRSPRPAARPARAPGPRRPGSWHQNLTRQAVRAERSSMSALPPPASDPSRRPHQLGRRGSHRELRDVPATGQAIRPGGGRQTAKETAR